MSKIKRFFRRKSLLRNIVLGILVVVTVGAAVGGVVALSRNTDKVDEALTYKTLLSTRYAVGGLDSTGAYMSTDKSIYTKKAFECQGLNVTPVFDSEVSYQIYFYDQNNEFVHTTGRLTGTFVQDSVPFFAKYARIVITPNDDNKVTIFEQAKYAKQLEVKVYREQGFKNYTEDLFAVRATSSILNGSGEVASSSNSSDVVSEYINIASYNEALYVRLGGEALSSGFKLHFYNASKTHLGYVDPTEATVAFTSSEGYHYYKVDFSDLSYSSDPVFVSYSTSSTNPVSFFCR